MRLFRATVLSWLGNCWRICVAFLLIAACLAAWGCAVVAWVVLYPEWRLVGRDSLAVRLAYTLVPSGWTAVAIFLSINAVRKVDPGEQTDPVVGLVGFPLAGLLLGAAHLDPRLWSLAWLGFAALAMTLHRSGGRVAPAIGVFVASYLAVAVSQHWLLGTVAYFSDTEEFPARLTFSGVVLVLTLDRTLPVVLGTLLFGRRLTLLWLPLAWVGGEWIGDSFYEYSSGMFLYSQWTVRPVLRYLATLGWYPTLALLLLALTGVGKAVAERKWWPVLPAMAITVLLPLLPRGGGDDGPLLDAAAVQLDNVDEYPEVPDNIDVLVWPEAVFAGWQRGEEGPQTDTDIIEGLPSTPRTGHLVNRAIKSQRGMLNAAVATDPLGRPTAVRGKMILVRCGERPFAGLGPDDEDSAFSRGRASSLLRVGRSPIVALICFEVYHRPLVARGKQEGGRMIAVLAHDGPLCGSRIAITQSIGALALRCAEYRLPGVRASLHGSAAIVSSDGTVVAMDEPDRAAILRVHHGGSRR